MKIAARATDNELRRRFARLGNEVEAAALAAADAALATQLDPAREPGRPSELPTPWLAPVLPGAHARMRRKAAAHAGKANTSMRAAVAQAVARALSRLKR